MKRNLQMLVALLLLVGTSMADPFDHDRDRHHKKHYQVPEPGSMMLVSLTGVALAGAFLARRFSENAAR